MSINDRRAPPRARPKFLIWRVVGNDLPPRHDAGTTLANLRFTLEHEPDFDDCEKRWLINRIVDSEVERRIVEVLDEHGAPWDRESFDPEVYRAQSVRYDKIRYAIDINGARNYVLRRGRSRARYTIPLDAGNFFSRAAWERLMEVVEGYERRGEDRRYFAVPMMRLGTLSQALDPELAPDARDEPQLVFREDADLEFDTRYRYGHRDKLELLRRLGKHAGFLLGDLENPHVYSESEASCPDAGWVLRLPSESSADNSSGNRFLRREDALDEFVRLLDESVGCGRDDGWEQRVATGVLDESGVSALAGVSLSETLDGLDGTPGLPRDRVAAALWVSAAYGPGAGEIVALEGAGGGAHPTLFDGAVHAGRAAPTVIRPEGEENCTLGGVRGWDRPIRLLFVGGARRAADIQEDLMHWLPFVVTGGLIAMDVSREFRGSTARERLLADTLRGSPELELVFHEQALLIVRKKKPVDDPA